MKEKNVMAFSLNNQYSSCSLNNKYNDTCLA